MPQYRFSNPENPNEYVDIILGMNDIKEYIKDGINWNREFFVPQASIDTKIDPHSVKDFVKATNKRGTIGDIMDRSAELSEIRAGTSGIDEIKEKHYENYSKKRGGSTHPDVVKRKAREKLKKAGVSVKE